MQTRLTFVVSVAAAAVLSAQVPQDRNQPVFRAGANYVRVDMYATRDGSPLQDLQPSELEVLEDGVPQKIEDFEHVIVRPAGVQSNRPVPDGLRASREAAGDPRARVFVIFLDTYHTQLEGSAIMRKPLAAFLDRVLGPDDLVALMTPEMAGSDIALGHKTKVIADVVSTEWWGRRARDADKDPKELLYEECLLDARRESLQPFRDPLVQEMKGRRREKLTLDALEDVMRHLGGLRDERKAVVLVTEGWLLYQRNPDLANKVAERMGGPATRIFEPPVPRPSDRGQSTPSRQQECQRDAQTLASMDSDLQFRVLTGDANRGNVTFYPVYARGLASFDAPIGPEYPPPLQEDMRNLRTRHEHLRTLAVETDGEAIIDTNYIEKGLKRIADDLSSYYLFGYYSTNTKLDGKYRSITVRVKRPGVRVRARRGYRARTAEQVVAAATATAPPVKPELLSALNSVVGFNSRSTFRVRPAAWTRPEGDAAGATVWIVGELDFRTRREPAWAGGIRADVLFFAADGSQLGTAQVDLPAGQGAFGVRMPTNGPLAPGDYAVRVRLRGRDAETSDAARVTIPEKPSAVGEALMWRRGTSTGPQFVRTSDPRFQRSDRLRLELPTAATDATARLVDRLGKVLQVPVVLTERSDAAEGVRWVVADVALAPLAPGDYAIEVSAGGSTQITGFRIIP